MGRESSSRSQRRDAGNVRHCDCGHGMVPSSSHFHGMPLATYVMEYGAGIET